MLTIFINGIKIIKQTKSADGNDFLPRFPLKNITYKYPVGKATIGIRIATAK